MRIQQKINKNNSLSNNVEKPVAGYMRPGKVSITL